MLCRGQLSFVAYQLSEVSFLHTLFSNGALLRRPGGSKHSKSIVFHGFGISYFGPQGLLLSPPWTILGPSSGTSWAAFGASGGTMGSSWSPPSPSWIPLGTILGAPFAPSSPHGAVISYFGAPRWHFGTIFGTILQPLNSNLHIYWIV